MVSDVKEKRVKITGFNHQGEGICRVNGKITFVKNTIPGEEIIVIIPKEKAKYNDGNLIKIIDSSERRANPACPYYGKCGGCNLMHLSYEDQLNFKENNIKDIIRKFYQKNVEIKPIISTIQFSYRNKGIFKVVGNEFGYYKNKTNEFIKIDKCLLMQDNINNALSKLDKSLLTNANELIVRSSSINDDVVMALKSKNGSLVYLTDKDSLLDRIGNYTYKISTNSFFQVNNIGVEKLYNKILDYANLSITDRVLDLYCGIGTIGIYVSKYAKEVIGIEINEQAILDAKENAKMNSISNISFLCNDGLDNIDDISYDVIIVDPPREGIRKETLDKIILSNAKKIIYVSCNPITLSRDLLVLDNKYDVIELTPIDMFPNTHHTECVCILKLR